MKKKYLIFLDQKLQLTYPYLLLWVIFALLDPDPDPDPLTRLNPDPIRIRNLGLNYARRTKKVTKP
jgi:hypothetical protein